MSDQAKGKIRANDEYNLAEFVLMEAALKLIIKRAEKGLQYGKDMPASRAAIFEDIKAIAKWEAWK